MVRAGMSISEKEKALAYIFGLGKASPKEWDLREVALDEGTKCENSIAGLAS